MANYLDRLAAIEERLGVKRCGPGLCVKCVLLALPVVRLANDDCLAGGGTGCDGHPVTTLSEILDSMRKDGTHDDELSDEA